MNKVDNFILKSGLYLLTLPIRVFLAFVVGFAMFALGVFFILTCKIVIKDGELDFE